MKLSIQNLNGAMVRLLAVTIVLLLSLGARGAFVITNYLGVASVAAQRPPVEEEEENHGKVKTTAVDRRHRERLPSPQSNSAWFGSLVVVTVRTFALPRVLPQNESDFFNGIGAPLRC